MNRQDEHLLNQAIEAVRVDHPDAATVSKAASRVAERLDIPPQILASGPIASCDDVQRLLPQYRDGALAEPTRMLVQTHLGECGACLRQFRQGPQGAVVDWSAPRRASANVRAPQHWGWALAATLLIGVSGLFAYRTFWAVPPGVRAEVQSIDGSAYLISDSGDRQISPGASIHEGDRLRTTGASRAILRLADGSTLEVNERTALHIGARGRNMTVWLDRGAAIVQAAHRTSGHLYLRTPDCRVAVTGTVFSVDAGIKGSRVSVLQGAVHVTHAGIDSTLNPGDQISTDDNLAAIPLQQEVSWSQDRDKYLALVAQVSLLAHRIGDIPLPQPRYSSDILDRIPTNTLLYVSIPNLGDFVSQANAIFKDQLAQSPELRQWWERGGDHNTAQLDEFVTRLHDFSQFIGDEMVVTALKDGNRPGFAILADVQKSGLADLLQQQFAASGLVIYDEKALSATKSADAFGQYALVRDHEVVFSNSLATLKLIDAQLNTGSSGFASSDFGKQIEAAYGRGAGIILAADLHQMVLSAEARGPRAHQAQIENSGLEKIQYLIAEHREINNLPQNHINLQFSGPRERIASWLAAPAPMGSLDFVSPNASIAVAGLSKDPAAIADDVIAMSMHGQDVDSELNKADQMLQIDLRSDIIANLGGEFLVALDGPVLPTPSWKAVVEVRNSARFEYALEKLALAVSQNQHGKNARQIAIEPSDVGGQRFYAVRDAVSGTDVADYTYSGGYMILAPNRALLMDALQTASSGDSLGRSASFRALLPKDPNENFSAIAYQNLSPVLTPLLSQLSGDTADAVHKLAADSRPTAICAWGEENRIEAGSDSRLFGFDFLTLGALLDSRNKNAQSHVIP